MDFENHTHHSARFLNTGWTEHALLGAVIARPTVRIQGTKLVETSDFPWPIEPAQVDTPAGPFAGDVPFLTGGVDVFVLGRVYQPGGTPAPDLQVEVRIGSHFRRLLDVFGDRVWEKRWGKLVPSDPEPFVSMQLSLEGAFGGTTGREGQQYVWPLNQGGKGFYLTAEGAEGNPLPNFEDAENPIASFDDQPEPFCLVPLPPDNGLRAMSAVELESPPDGERIRRITPRLFNRAHPKMVIPPEHAPHAGDEVAVTCVRPGGDLRFSLPEHTLHAHVQLEDQHHLFPLHLDLIGILAEEQRVVLGYRVVFEYAYRRMERRATTLHRGPVPAAMPASYMRVWEDDKDR
jgi:hypothetical protein